MKISCLLNIEKGITALIGGGGKTTLMYTLAEELEGRVIITTSTRILPPEQYPVLLSPTAEEIGAAMLNRRIVCVGKQTENGKLTAASIPFERLAELADYVIVEADGARRLPLKAHASYEPVIPDGTRRTVMVVGLDGIGKKICETCHRPELYAAAAGVATDTVVTPEIASRVIKAEGYGDCVYINKAETEADYKMAGEIAGFFDCPVFAGSLQKGEYRKC